MPKTELTKYKNTNMQVLPMAKDDLQAVCNMAAQSIRKRGSRTIVFPDTPEGLQAFVDAASEYFDYVAKVNSECEGDDIKLIPGVEGLCTFLGFSRVTLFNYEKRGGDWAATIGYIKTAIAGAKMQLAQRFKIPPVVMFFDLINNAGYHNTHDIKVTHENSEEKKQKSNAELLESLRGAIVEEAEADPDAGGTF